MKKDHLNNRVVWQTLSIGIEIALSIVIGLGIGWWLDQKLNTTPIFLILGIVSGIGSAIKAVIRIVKIDCNNHT